MDVCDGVNGCECVVCCVCGMCVWMCVCVGVVDDDVCDVGCECVVVGRCVD